MKLIALLFITVAAQASLAKDWSECTSTAVLLGTYKFRVEEISQTCGWTARFQRTIDEVAQLSQRCSEACAGAEYTLNQCLNFAQATMGAVEINRACAPARGRRR